MKKFLSVLLTIVMIVPMTVTVSAETAAPALTVTNVDSTTNKLSWTKADGAESYVIYLLNEDTSKYKKYGEVKGTSCRDKNLTPNTKYTYRVRAKFPDGTLGKFSKAASVWTINKYGNCYDALGTGGMTNIYTAVQGEWIYFSVCPADNSCQYNSGYGSLYRVRTDGTDLRLLKKNCFARYLNAVGDRLYYIDLAKDNTTYTIKSCGLDGKNTKTLVRDKELDGYEDWLSCAIEELKIIDGHMLFNVSALEGWYDGNNIYALDLNGGELARIAGYGYMAADDLSDDHTEEDEAAARKTSENAEAERVMSKGYFTDIILRSAYNSPRLKEFPELEKLLEPREKWLYAYDGKLYLCGENGNETICDNYNDSGSALLSGDTVYYVWYDKAGNTNYLMKYENGGAARLYNRENAGYSIFYAGGGKVFFIEKTYDSSEETMALGIRSVNTDGSDPETLWECKYTV